MEKIYVIYDNISKKNITVFMAANERDAKRVFRHWMMTTKQDVDFDYSIYYFGNVEFSMQDDLVFTSDEIFKQKINEVEEEEE